MIKNFLIAAQALVIVLGIAFGALWYSLYKHEILQTFQVSSLGFIANETRWMTQVDERLARGDVEEARGMLRAMIASNTEDMKATVATLDLRQAARLDDAEHWASLVDEAGIPQVTELIRERAERQRRQE